jgi:hypothetical protein
MMPGSGLYGSDREDAALYEWPTIRSEQRGPPQMPAYSARLLDGRAVVLTRLCGSRIKAMHIGSPHHSALSFSTPFDPMGLLLNPHSGFSTTGPISNASAHQLCAVPGFPCADALPIQPEFVVLSR